MDGKSMRWADGFIGVDWGTTNRRAYRIDSAGHCAAEFEDAKGVLSVPSGRFHDAVREIRDRLGDLPLLMAGMVGSNRGWVEAPYVNAPSGLDELAEHLVWAGEREAIVPGISYLSGERADVMRGEEVQLLGAVASGEVDADGFVCHPGTHNKWCVLRQCQLHSFRTVMTGELFSLLKAHSILSDLLAGPVEPNEAFRAGAHRGLYEEALPADLFEIRARVLLGQSRKEDAASFASALLIGTDVRIGLSHPAAAEVTVMGRPELTRLYAAALDVAGRSSNELDGEKSFLAGIADIAPRS
jgi:2-dehydro-3-deoxygalactonokinase